MRRTNPVKRMKAGAAGVLLCVHLFGMLVSTILHPLYHAHFSHFSCAAGKRAHPEEDGRSFFNEEKDKVSAHAQTGDHCVLCQWKVNPEYIRGKSHTSPYIPVFSSHYKGNYTHAYPFERSSHLPVRGPPVW